MPKRLITIAFFSLSVAAALAQVQRPGHFYERPGVLEFSGEMIVRPWQATDLAKKGLNQLEQAILSTRARNRLAPIAKEHIAETGEYIIQLPMGTTENLLSKNLVATGDYQYVTPNWICYPVRTPNDPLYGQQWHHPIVHSPEAWNLVRGSASPQIAAVVDTGIDITHPDLSANRVPGFNSADRIAEVDGGQVMDINGHGTHVAGDAAAIGNNSAGVSGMGWNFKVMMIRTSNSPSGGAAISDILAGARWAAEHGAKTISASYSGVDDPTIQTTGAYIKGRNALFCYAAGNDNRDLTGFVHPDVIVVGASDQSDGKAGFSAYGRGVHVFAPGVSILSTTLGGGYGGASGTSMATPVTNGALALIWAANPGLTSSQVQTILENNCDSIGPSAIFGHGRINQFRNVQNALALLGVNTVPTSITTTHGTYLRGTLANILNLNTGGPSYDVNSLAYARSGRLAGVELTYRVAATPSKVISLNFTYQAAAQPTTVVTAFVYAWNYTTGAYESLVQFPLSSSFRTQTKAITVNPSRFIGPNGVVKTLYRAISTQSGGGAAPFPYMLKFGHTKLSYSALP